MPMVQVLMCPDILTIGLTLKLAIGCFPALIQSQISSQLTWALTHNSEDGIQVHSFMDNINRGITFDSLVKWQKGGSPASSLLGSYTSGLFMHASHFSINQPIMGEHIVVNNAQMVGDLWTAWFWLVQTTEAEACMMSLVLERMLDHIIPGAESDSSDCDSPPWCHPGTWTHFLKQLQTHIHDKAGHESSGCTVLLVLASLPLCRCWWKLSPFMPHARHYSSLDTIDEMMLRKFSLLWCITLLWSTLSIMVIWKRIWLLTLLSYLNPLKNSLNTSS